MEIFKIIGIALITCFLAVIIKSIKPEFYILVVLIGSIIIISMLIKNLETVVSYFYSLIQKTNIDYSLFIVMLKVIGIAFLTEFSASICIDTGNSSLADKIILAGKIIVLCVSLPIISNLFNLIFKILP